MKDTKIIGLRAKKSVGKDFIAKRIDNIIKKDLLKTVQIGAFADPIKKFFIENLGISSSLCYGNDQDKNTLTEYDWQYMFDSIRYDNGKFAGPMTIRELMQIFGTDICRRIFGNDIWIKRLKKTIDESTANYFIIPDVRYTDEVKVIRENWKGQVWQIIGDQRTDEISKKDKHSSEKIVEVNIPVDIFLENQENDFNNLDNKLLELLKNI